MISAICQVGVKISTSVSTQNSTPVKPKKNKWYQLYYVLAAFDVITILASLLLNHRILDIHSESLKLSELWVQRLGRFEELSSTLGRVNAPGNEIFDTKDVKTESAKLELELKIFQHNMLELERDSLHIAKPEQRAVIGLSLRNLNSAMSEMVQEAGLIFNYFKQGNETKAGSRMATMDRKYGVLNAEMAHIRTQLLAFQKQDLVEQQSKASSLGVFEYAFAGVVILIICLVTVYGYEVSRRFDQAQKLIDEQQAQIEISAKMSSLGEMAGGIAHEVNSPLASILLRAEQLKEMGEAGKIDSSQLTKRANSIIETCMKISKIIKGLRTFSRDGRGDPFLTERLQGVVDDTLVLCQEKIRSRNISLQINLPEILPEKDLCIDCRATDISQVLLNLLSNSIDAVEGKETPWIKLAVKEQPESIEISVTDNGSGIPHEIREKIMQPFFTTKEISKGTGLGLSIVRGIVESHNGKIYLDQESVNTRFVVTLPKKQSANESADRPAKLA